MFLYFHPTNASIFITDSMDFKTAKINHISITDKIIRIKINQNKFI